MKKTLFTKIAIFAVLSMLLIPNAAALPEVGIHIGYNIIWKTENTVEFEGEIDTATMYQKLNVSEITALTDKILVNFSVYETNETNFLTYGWENASIWEGAEELIDDDFKYLNESEPTSHYKYYFNEQNAKMTDISEDALFMLSLMANPSAYVNYILALFLVAFGAYDVLVNSNTTMFNSASDRSLDYNITIFTVLEDVSNPGILLNITVSNRHQFVYGGNSNVLLQSNTTSSSTIVHFDTDLDMYVTETKNFNVSTSAVYPDWVVEDVPVGSNDDGGDDGEGGLGELLKNIPGFPRFFLGLATVAGIFFVLKKRT